MNLSNYPNGEFRFSADDRLSSVCNVPKGQVSGLYKIYGLFEDTEELIYIGISGLVVDGVFKHRKNGLRGRFLTGKQFGDRRSKSWPVKMREDGISKLRIEWYILYDDVNSVIPRVVEAELLNTYKAEYGVWPKWNREG